MCFLPSTASAGANPPAPTNNVADNLVLGISSAQNRNAALLGRNALKAPATTPGASPASGNSTPGGTLGVQADMGLPSNPAQTHPGVPNYGVHP